MEAFISALEGIYEVFCDDDKRVHVIFGVTYDWDRRYFVIDCSEACDKPSYRSEHFFSVKRRQTKKNFEQEVFRQFQEFAILNPELTLYFGEAGRLEDPVFFTFGRDALINKVMDIYRPIRSSEIFQSSFSHKTCEVDILFFLSDSARSENMIVTLSYSNAYAADEMRAYLISSEDDYPLIKDLKFVGVIKNDDPAVITKCIEAAHQQLIQFLKKVKKHVSATKKVIEGKKPVNKPDFTPVSARTRHPRKCQLKKMDEVDLTSDAEKEDTGDEAEDESGGPVCTSTECLSDFYYEFCVSDIFPGFAGSDDEQEIQADDEQKIQAEELLSSLQLEAIETWLRESDFSAKPDDHDDHSNIDSLAELLEAFTLMKVEKFTKELDFDEEMKEKFKCVEAEMLEEQKREKKEAELKALKKRFAAICYEEKQSPEKTKAEKYYETKAQKDWDWGRNDRSSRSSRISLFDKRPKKPDFGEKTQRKGINSIPKASKLFNQKDKDHGNSSKLNDSYYRFDINDYDSEPLHEDNVTKTSHTEESSHKTRIIPITVEGEGPSSSREIPVTPAKSQSLQDSEATSSTTLRESEASTSRKSFDEIVKAKEQDIKPSLNKKGFIFDAFITRKRKADDSTESKKFENHRSITESIVSQKLPKFNSDFKIPKLESSSSESSVTSKDYSKITIKGRPPISDKKKAKMAAALSKLPTLLEPEDEVVGRDYSGSVPSSSAVPNQDIIDLTENEENQDVNNNENRKRRLLEIPENPDKAYKFFKSKHGSKKN